MHFRELLQQYAAGVGYPSVPQGDSAGNYSFTFDSFRVACREEAGRCLMQGTIGPNDAEETRREETFRHLLQASLVRGARGRGVFAFDRTNNEFILYDRFDFQNMGPRDIEDRMDAFLNEMEFWVEQLGRELGPPQGPMQPVGLRL